MYCKKILRFCFLVVGVALLTNDGALSQQSVTKSDSEITPGLMKSEPFDLNETDGYSFQSAGTVSSFFGSDNYVFVSEEQSWQPFVNPQPEYNFNIYSGANYAGDVTGNGHSDLVISSDARDERTGSLEDVVGKTVLFEGGNYSTDPDQLLYENLTPVGDLNASGHNDAFTTDDDNGEISFFTGSDDGYEDSGINFNMETGNIYTSFADISGSGYEDVVFMDQNSTDIEVLFGDEDLDEVSTTTISTDFPVFAVALVDITNDASAEIAVLTRYHGENDILTLYQVEQGGDYQIHHEIVFEDTFDTFPNLHATKFEGNDFPELLITDDTEYAHIIPYIPDMGEFSIGDMIQTTSGYPAGDIDDSGHTDMFFQDGADIHVAYGPDNLFEWDDELPEDETLDFPVEDVSISVMSYPPTVGFGDISGNDIDDFIFSYYEEDNFGRVYLKGDEDQEYDYEVLSVDVDTYAGEQVFGTENLGDVNDNGYDDVAFLHTTQGKERIAVYYGGETMSDSPDLEIESTFRSVYSIETGDFNGDGEQDLAFAVGRYRSLDTDEDDLSGIHIFYGSDLEDIDLESGNADHIIRYDDLDDEVDPQASITNIENVGDLNDNGADDLLYSSPSTDTDEYGISEKVFITNGGSSISSDPDIRIANYSGARLQALGDITGNGTPDFAMSDFMIGDKDGVYVFIGDESGDYTEHDLELEHDYESVTGMGIGLASGDLNGNGINDIAVLPYNVVDESADPEIHIYYGGDDLDEDPDQLIELPYESLISGSFDDNITNTGSLEIIPDLFGEDTGGLLYTSGTSNLTNAAVIQIDEDSSQPIQQYILEAPNQDAGLGGNNNFINIQSSNAYGNFTGAGSKEVILTQYNDGNDMAGTSRVYRFAIPSALELVDVADRTEDHGGWVVLEYEGALIDAKQSSQQLFNELDVQRKDDGDWVSTGKVIKYDEELADRIEVPVPVTKPTGEDPSDETTFTFRLTAYDSDSGVIARSNTESGYAKDNIPPGEVAGFSVEEEGEQIVFSWDALDDPNMDGYLLFKADDEGEIDLEDPESFTSETTYTIDKPEEGEPHYAVAGLDQHNNIGEPTETVNVPTSAPTGSDIPDEFALNDNYPNPFNPTTTIRYDLPESSEVRIEVYNVLGQHVSTLVNETRQAGHHEVTFDAADLSSGTYIYRIEAGDFVDSRQMLLVK